MEKIKLGFGELNALRIEYESQKKHNLGANFYQHLLFDVLKLEIKDEYLLIRPDFSQIDLVLELQFLNKQKPYQIVIDGQNKCIVAGGVKLFNITRCHLKYLYQELLSPA